MINQYAADTLTPSLRLDKERVQLRVAVVARKNRGETRHRASDFCDEDTASFDLLQWQRDSVRILQQSFAVAGIFERRAPLERLELPLLGHQRWPDLQDAHRPLLLFGPPNVST